MTAPDLPDWLTKASLSSDLTIFGPQAIVAGGNTNFLSVQNYQSIMVSTSQIASTFAECLQVQWYDINQVFICSDIITNPADNLGVVMPNTILPVRGPYCAVFNRGHSNQTTTVLGSPRTVPGQVAIGYMSYQLLQLPNAVYANNTTYLFGSQYFNMQGLVQYAMEITGGVMTGQLQYSIGDNTGATQIFPLIDQTNFASFGGNRWGYGQFILPAVRAQPQFAVITGATAAVNLYLTPLGH